MYFSFVTFNSSVCFDEYMCIRERQSEKGVKICRPCRVVLEGVYKWTEGWVLGGEASLALKMFAKTLRAQTEMYSP